MADLSSKGVVNLVSDEVKQIYGLLEADFTPLELCHRLAPLLQALESVNKEMSGQPCCSAGSACTLDVPLYRRPLAVLGKYHVYMGSEFCRFRIWEAVAPWRTENKYVIGCLEVFAESCLPLGFDSMEATGLKCSAEKAYACGAQQGEGQLSGLSALFSSLVPHIWVKLQC